MAKRKSGLPRLEHRRMQLAELTAAPYNPRQITDPALGGLRKSLERFGLVQPIVWNSRTARIVGGHQRVKALRLAGESEADVVVVSLSEPEEKALNMALNNPAIAGEFTGDAAALLREIEQATSDLFADLRLDTLADMIDPSDVSENEVDIKPLSIQRPPNKTWVLIGIPTVRFDEISDHIEKIEAISGVDVEVTANSEDGPVGDR